MIPQEWFLCIFARTLPWPSVLRVCLFSVHLVMIMMVMAMLMVHPGMGHVLLRGRQGSLQGCSGSDQARSTSQGIIILIIILSRLIIIIIIKSCTLWLFSIQSHKFTNHPGMLRQCHCIESNCNNLIQLKKVPSLFFLLNVPGSPAVSFNVRNPWGAEALAGWHSSGGVPHSTGAKIKKTSQQNPPGAQAWCHWGGHGERTQVNNKRHIFSIKNICIHIHS